MKKLFHHLISLSFLLSILMMGSFYGLFNNANRGARSFITQLDQATPFFKIFVIPYMAWYPFIIGTMIYLCMKDRKTYYRTLVAYNISLAVCYLVYYFYQTTVPRPELVGNDFLTRFMAYVYANDNPYNCFPSIHVLSSYLMMIAIAKSSARNFVNTLGIYIMGTVIILSTLFVKQHVIIDVISGIFLADILFRVVYVIEWEPVFYPLEKFIGSLIPYNKLKRETSS